MTTLRSRLDALGLSPTDLARLTGTAPSAVWHWLSGRRPIPPWLPVLLDLLEHHPAEVRRLMRDAA